MQTHDKCYSVRLTVLILALALSLFACNSGDDDDDAGDANGNTVTGVEGVQFNLSLEENSEFYETPFPTELRRNDDGTVRLDDFPNPYAPPGEEPDSQASSVIELFLSAGTQNMDGFGTNSGVYFQFDGWVDSASLPASVPESVSFEAAVYLVNVDPQSPGYNTFVPIETYFYEDIGKYHPPLLLAMVPVQGYVLRPLTTYAAVVTRKVKDASGDPLGVPQYFAEILQGIAPDAPLGEKALATYTPLLDWIEEQGIDSEQIAAATVYKTRDPISEMVAIVEADQAMATPELVDLPSLNVDDCSSGCAFYDNCYDDDFYHYGEFYLVEGEFELPNWQQGTAPFADDGGNIDFVDGVPQQNGSMTVKFALAVPKGQMPAAGFPIIQYMHGSGGDRSSGLYTTDDTTIPRGFAVGGIDAPLHGMRGCDDSGVLFYNFLNPHAFRDNIRQAVSDSVVFNRFLLNLELDAGLFADVDASAATDGKIRFDDDNLYLHSHSQGSTMSPIVLALDKKVKAGILSGAGSSMILVLLTKTLPINIPAIVGAAINLKAGEQLSIYSPVLNMIQAMGEAADSLNFSRYVLHEPLEGFPAKQVYQPVGIVDHYVDPQQQHALATALGIDVTGDILDDDILTRLDLVGSGAVDYPVTGNIESVDGSLVTGVAHQFSPPVDDDGDDDYEGHFVSTHEEDAMHEYGCFLQSIVENNGGAASVPQGGDDRGAVCP
jgi:hypothetical protein